MNFKNLFKRNKNLKKRDTGMLSNYTVNAVPTLLDITGVSNDDGISGIDIAASHFASLSLKIYSTRNNKLLKEHWLSDLIKNPNEDEVQYNFFYNMAYDYLTSGNIYLYVYSKHLAEKPTALFRLIPNEVSVTRNEHKRKIFTHNGKQYTADHILHIPSRFEYNGTIGKSIFKKHSETFATFTGLNTQLKKSSSGFAVEGERPVLDISEAFDNISDEQADAFRDKFINEYSGPENAYKPIVIKKGFKLNSLKGALLSQKEQQFYENRKEQKEIINDIIGIPKGFTGGETNLSLEDLHILFLGNAIRPIAISVAQYFTKLLNRFDGGKTRAEFNFNSLLRTGLQTRIDSYAKQLGNAILTPNEIRNMEGLPCTQDDSGDNLFIPANILPLQKEIVDSFLASSRLKLAEAQEKENEKNEKKLLNLGDDKK